LLTLKFVFERLGEVAPEQLTGKHNPDSSGKVPCLTRTDKLPKLIDLLIESRIESAFSFSSEVQAAYLEVVNLIWAYQHRERLPFSPIKLPSSMQASGALQRKQQAISMAYLTTQKRDGKIAALEELLLSGITGADTAVSVLEVVSTLWQSESVSNEELIALSQVYVALCHQSSCKEVQGQAMLNLADNVDRLLLRNATDTLSEALSKLWVALPLMSMNPFFANAITRASGGVMAALSRSNKLGPDGLSSWGHIMAEAGREDKVCFHSIEYTHEKLTSSTAGL
jgi:hypothetical protein